MTETDAVNELVGEEIEEMYQSMVMMGYEVPRRIPGTAGRVENELESGFSLVERMKFWEKDEIGK
jgi:hypothetical protein